MSFNPFSKIYSMIYDDPKYDYSDINLAVSNGVSFLRKEDRSETIVIDITQYIVNKNERTIVTNKGTIIQPFNNVYKKLNFIIPPDYAKIINILIESLNNNMFYPNYTKLSTIIPKLLEIIKKDLSNNKYNKIAMTTEDASKIYKIQEEYDKLVQLNLYHINNEEKYNELMDSVKNKEKELEIKEKQLNKRIAIFEKQQKEFANKMSNHFNLDDIFKN